MKPFFTLYKNLSYFRSRRFIYETPPENVDQNESVAEKNNTDDAEEMRKKYEATVTKLRNHISQYKNTSDPFIQEEIKKAESGLAAVEGNNRLTEGEKDHIIEQIEGRIIVFNARDVDKSLAYVQSESDVEISLLSKELEEFEEKDEKNKEDHDAIAAVNQHINRIHQIQNTAESALMLFEKPTDAGKRALIIANFKDQLFSVTTGYQPEGAYVSIAEDLTGEYLDATALSLQDAEKGGGTESSEFVKNMNGETIGLKNFFEFRLDGSGMPLTKLVPGTIVRIMSPKVYQFTDQQGRPASFMKVKIGDDGAVGFIRIDLTKKFDSFEPGSSKTKEEPMDEAKLDESEFLRKLEPLQSSLFRELHNKFGGDERKEFKASIKASIIMENLLKGDPSLFNKEDEVIQQTLSIYEVQAKKEASADEVKKEELEETNEDEEDDGSE